MTLCKEQTVLGRQEMPRLFSLLYWLARKPFMPKHSGGVLPWCDSASFLLREIPRKLLSLWRLGGEEGIEGCDGDVVDLSKPRCLITRGSKFGFVWALCISWLLQQLEKKNCIFRLCCWIWEGFFHSFYYVLRLVVIPRSNLNRKHKPAASFLSQTPFILHSSLPSRCCFHFF